MSPRLLARCPRSPLRALFVLLASHVAALPATAQLLVRSGSTEATAVAIDPGDLLIGWRPEGRGDLPLAPFDSWADAWWMDVREVPGQGRLEIAIERAGKRYHVFTRTQALDLDVAPLLPDAALEELDRRTATDEALGAATLEAVRSTFAPLGSDASTWALAEVGKRAAARGDVDLSVAAFRAAADAESGPFAGELLRRGGDVLARSRRTDEALEIFREAVAIWQQREPDGVGESIALSSLGSSSAASIDCGRRSRCSSAPSRSGAGGCRDPGSSPAPSTTWGSSPVAPTTWRAPSAGSPRRSTSSARPGEPPCP